MAYSDVEEVMDWYYAERAKIQEIYDLLWGPTPAAVHPDVHEKTLSRITRLMETEWRMRGLEK